MLPGKARVTPPAEHRPTGASLIAILLAFMCFGAVMLLHAVRGEINPLRQVMSEYANGSHGILMTIVFYAFGLTSIALAFRLKSAIHQPGITRAFPALLVLAGVGLIASGVFEVERAMVPDTIEEVIHSDATVVAFVLLITAMLLFSLACRSDDSWWPFRWVSLSLTLLAAFAAMVTPLSAGSGWSGAVQRVLGLAILAWLLLTALHVRGKAFRAR
jgi:Protein of unknown function (DUF998)/Anaerobic c4-dicarboxylate membrane transporter